MILYLWRTRAHFRSIEFHVAATWPVQSAGPQRECAWPPPSRRIHLRIEVRGRNVYSRPLLKEPSTENQSTPQKTGTQGLQFDASLAEYRCEELENDLFESTSPLSSRCHSEGRKLVSFPANHPERSVNTPNMTGSGKETEESGVNSQEYVFDQIVEYADSPKRIVLYCIHWYCYPSDEGTWEPWKHLTSSKIVASHRKTGTTPPFTLDSAQLRFFWLTQSQTGHGYPNSGEQTL